MKKLKILLDNAYGHITIDRMLPYWKKMGHDITLRINEPHDVVLSYVRFAFDTKRPKILRLDGIYYDSDTNYNERNKEISNSHSIADGVIYQSNYSKLMIENLLKSRKETAKYSVIYNGIESNWCGTKQEHDGINIVITGKHRRHKRLKEIIELFTEYNKLYSNSTLHIFGKLHDNKEVKHKNIKYYGHVERDKMINVFKISDFSLHLSKRDSCPNSVIEYIGSGIPVITTNNCGGATEICRLTNNCIIVNDDGDYNDVNPVPHYGEKWNKLSKDVFENLLKAMVYMTENKKSVILPQELTAEYQANEYIKIMKNVL